MHRQKMQTRLTNVIDRLSNSHKQKTLTLFAELALGSLDIIVGGKQLHGNKRERFKNPRKKSSHKVVQLRKKSGETCGDLHRQQYLLNQ